MSVDITKIFKASQFQLVPAIDNLYFYNEVDIFPGDILEKKTKAIRKIIQEKHRYELFLMQKGRRPNYDAYACFQPFNEATKALYPFLKRLQQQVKDGDIILNLWDRSGWLTTLLSGLFPKQQIITTWEGNKDILGYKGFSFWMKENKNVSILFCDLNAPLPLQEKSIAFSIGLDALHRFHQHTLLNELMRVVKDDGAIIFPHVHLSNVEPEPYFDRGGKQMHGKDYDLAFKHLTENTHWKGFVFSEPDLFTANDIACSSSIPLISDPNTTDYNALIALLPESWENECLSAFSLKDIPNREACYIVVNTLLRINLNEQKVFIDYAHLNGAAGSLLKRHPVYIERIKLLDNYQLTALAAKTIFLANKGYTVKAISSKLNIAVNTLVSELEILEQLGLVQVLPVSIDGIRLQNFLMTQQYIIPKSRQNLKALWQHSVKAFPDNIALISLMDESEFTYKDCDEIIKNILLTLQKNNLKKGDKIIICSKIHSEAILLFWACMQAGIVVVPIGMHLTAASFSFIVEQTEAKLCFTNQSVFTEGKYNFEHLPTILFDETAETATGLYFADWLTEAEDISFEEENISQNDGAVILFTSGSTGVPKGVEISHGNLFRSGRLITETFLWEAEDRFFAFGGLDSMSGLRNATIAPVHVGASVIIPAEISTSNLFNIAEAIADNRVSILGCNPAMLHQFVKHKEKIGDQLTTVKTLMCTGNNLNNSLRTEFEKIYNLPILNYYGLTETTGICIAQSSLANKTDLDTIGLPIDCIAQIVNEQGAILPVGEEGELRIFSENLMQGYFKDTERTDLVLKDGWFYTLDLARYTAEGNIQLIGRKRDIVKTANEELVYLGEIQQFIHNLSIVEDCYVGSFQKENSEKIAAFVVVKKGSELSEPVIKEQIKNEIRVLLGENKIPNQIKILAKLPYNEAGKLLTNQLINELN
jgi:acyl-coenzyme A synthetase/AMP-(fatty) acid ligase